MAEKQVIEIDDYYDSVHRKTWARRTASYIAGASMGVGYGAVIGTIAAFLPYILGAVGLIGPTIVATLPALSPATVFASAAAFAEVCGLAGIASVGLVGANAASVAAGLEEKEKREKLEKYPGKNQDDYIVKTKEIKDHLAPKIFSWRIGAVTSTLFAAFGALLAYTSNHAVVELLKAAFPKAVGVMTTGVGEAMAVSTPGIAAAAALFAMFGAVISLKNSYLTNKVTNFYYSIMTEQFFSKDKGVAQTVTLEPQAEKSNGVAVDYEIAQEKGEGKSFADGQRKSIVQALIDKTDDRGKQEITR